MKLLILSVIFAATSPGNALLGGENFNTSECTCVLHENCYKGFLNTEGVGIIVVRNDISNVEPEKQCANTSYVCCFEKTEFEPRGEVTLAPLSEGGGNKQLEECGKQKPFINVRVQRKSTDFSSTLDGEFPWLVSIHIKSNVEGANYVFKCSGSLIRDNVVLTAAHCVKSVRAHPANVKVLANALAKFTKIGDDPRHERSVEKIETHPEYYAAGPHNDIALIFLENSYNETIELNTICIPSSDTENSYETTRCMAVGWGSRKENLEKVELPLVEFKACEDMLKKTKLGDEFKLHDSFVCAGGEKGRDTCKGDGGGPLMCPDKYGFLYQLGIVSWGVGCGELNHPGMYTHVAKFHKWIVENIEKT